MHFNIWAEPDDVVSEQPDVVVIATGGLPNTALFETTVTPELATTSWDIISGDVKPASSVLIFDEVGDHAGLQAAEIALKAGSRIEIMTPDRTFAPDVMAMNLTPYMRTLQHENVTFTVTKRLMKLEKIGNRLAATIGTDYSALETVVQYDQVVINYGTRPLDELYFDLKPLSSNKGQINYNRLIGGQEQTHVHNGTGSFRLYRIGDAVSLRNTHAAIYDALRLMNTI